MIYCNQCGIKNTKSSKFCSSCGFNLSKVNSKKSEIKTSNPKKETVDLESLSKPNKAKVRQTLKCIKCKSDTQLQRVSVIIESGTIQTKGFSVSTPIFNDHPIKNSFLTQSASVSSTPLVQRLLPAPIPTFPFSKLFINYWLVSSIPFTILSFLASFNSKNENQESSNLLVNVFFGLFLGLFFGALIAFFEQNYANAVSVSQIRHSWEDKNREHNAAYYCFRDDVVFNEEFSGTPEEFRNWMFAGLEITPEMAPRFLSSQGSKVTALILAGLCVFGAINSFSTSSEQITTDLSDSAEVRTTKTSPTEKVNQDLSKDEQSEGEQSVEKVAEEVRCIPSKNCPIGSIGPAGGIVFYDAKEPQSWGQYFEVSSKTPIVAFGWCPIKDNSNVRPDLGTSIEIGAGKKNTDILKISCASGAGKSAQEFEDGGFSDWYIPSLGEIEVLKNSKVWSMVSDLGTWGSFASSSQVDASPDYKWSISNGSGWSPERSSDVGPVELIMIRNF